MQGEDIRILVLRLSAPLASFGDVAIDTTRPTDDLPGLSMITGLLGNALGWTAADAEDLQRLQDRIRLASRAERSGDGESLLRDYQTVKVSKDDRLWRTDGIVSRRTFGGEKELTIERQRYYRAGTAVTTLISLDDGDGPGLQDLRDALRHPVHPLYIGRASCPPSRPICHEPGGREIITSPNFEIALKRLPLIRSASATGTNTLLEWPLAPEAARNVSRNEVSHVVERKDIRRWRENVHGGSRLVWREIYAFPGTEATR